MLIGAIFHLCERLSECLIIFCVIFISKRLNSRTNTSTHSNRFDCVDCWLKLIYLFLLWCLLFCLVYLLNVYRWCLPFWHFSSDIYACIENTIDGWRMTMNEFNHCSLEIWTNEKNENKKWAWTGRGTTSVCVWIVGIHTIFMPYLSHWNGNCSILKSTERRWGAEDNKQLTKINIFVKCISLNWFVVAAGASSWLNPKKKQLSLFACRPKFVIQVKWFKRVFFGIPRFSFNLTFDSSKTESELVISALENLEWIIMRFDQINLNCHEMI